MSQTAPVPAIVLDKVNKWYGTLHVLHDVSLTVAERERVALALGALPPEQRAAVLLVDRDGFDYRAAATALSIPLGTVSSRLAAARAKLRDALAPDHERGDE